MLLSILLLFSDYVSWKVGTIPELLEVTAFLQGMLHDSDHSVQLFVQGNFNTNKLNFNPIDIFNFNIDPYS